MKVKKIDAVKMKRALQKKSERKLSELSNKEKLEFLSQKFGHLKRTKKVAHVA